MNERPKSIEKWSPNYTPRDPGREISCVILHATAGGKEASLEWLCDPASKVSAHYVIDDLGAVYHLVHEQNEAYHAGESVWRDRPYCNGYSVGIELVNPNDGTTPYPEPQIEACANLVAAICIEHGISATDVIGHKDVAPGRKTDPAGFDFEAFRGMLRELGVA